MGFLKKHARFLVVLVLSAGLLYFASGQLKDYAGRVDAARTKAKTLLTSNYTALFTDAAKFGGEPATVQGRKVQDRTQVLQQHEGGRNELLAFNTDREYTLSALPQGARGDDHINYYRGKVTALQQQLAYSPFFVSDANAPRALGFDATRATLTAADVPDYLRRLDIVRAVAGSVRRSAVPRLQRLQFVEPATELAARGVPVAPAAEGEPPYLQGQGLEIEIGASEEALYNFLADLQRPTKGALRGRYLSVEKFTLDKPDLLNPANDLVQAKVTVVAWTVNEESSWPQERGAKGQQQTSTRAPRPFR
jgi:hypothetical protein